MPKNSEKAMMAMAFLLESFVFSNHMHGREHLDAQLHVFLAYAVYGIYIGFYFSFLHLKHFSLFRIFDVLSFIV